MPVSCNDPGITPFSRASMTRRRLVQGAVGLGGIGLAFAGRGWAASTASTGTPPANATPALAHWAYEGEEGPEHWGDLDPSWSACSSGEMQSPIDIAGATRADLPDITFSGQSLSPITIINNGHSVQVEAQPGNTIAIDGVTYELTQFHFHAMSEHRVGGQQYPMELHLVHADETGNLLVLGVFLQEGDEHAALKPVFGNLPPTPGSEQVVDGSVILGDLLPDSKLAYRYGGSLTTPPCTEGVQWIVFVEPMDVSAEQIGAFRALYPANARPVQPLNDRVVEEGE
jgi:carbonic anhydrase